MGLVVGGSALLFTFVGPFLYQASGLDNPVGDCSPVGASSPVGSSSPVGASSPVGTCSPISNLSPTTLTLTLTTAGDPGRFITVDSSTAVTAQATLAGAKASTASGTVTYKIFSLKPSHWSWNPVVFAGKVTVADGAVPASNAVTLYPGVYAWSASYSGDSVNAPSRTQFHSNLEIVVPVGCPTNVGWWSVRCFGDNSGHGNSYGNGGHSYGNGGNSYGNGGNSYGNGGNSYGSGGGNGGGYDRSGNGGGSDNGGGNNGGGNQYGSGSGTGGSGGRGDGGGQYGNDGSGHNGG